MFLRTTRAGGHEYVQLAHNYRDPETGTTKPKILYSFGRAEQLDLDALRRLVRSIARYLEDDDLREFEHVFDEGVSFDYLGSRRLGGPWFLDGLWQRLGIAKTIKRLIADRRFRSPVERLIFAMVANRALAPASKLALEDWVGSAVFIEDLPQVEVHQRRRAMDLLLEAAEELQRRVFFSVADLFNLECDLIFLDTTTFHFEIEAEDSEEDGLRRRGRSKGLPEAVIGVAMTREGIPVRCWTWPGNTADPGVIEEVKRDLNGWRLGRVITVLDGGFNSEANRRVLQGAGGHTIIGERLRVGQKGQPVEALRRGGKYKRLENGLEAKEVTLGDGPARQRFVVVRNPEETERARHKRDDIVAEVERRLDELGELEGEPHEKAACELRAHPVYGRYIRQTKRGKLRLDKSKIRREAQLDGKFLIRVSDDQLTVEDAVLGYKGLWQIERIFRDLKHVVDIRPVYHRLEERIRSHVLLCWLAMLLIRVAENESGLTWHQMRRELAKLEVGIHRTPSGEIWQRNHLTEELKALFEALDLKLPPRYLAIPTPQKQPA